LFDEFVTSAIKVNSNMAATEGADKMAITSAIKVNSNMAATEGADKMAIIQAHTAPNRRDFFTMASP
jgi:hypothetical protein